MRVDPTYLSSLPSHRSADDDKLSLIRPFIYLTSYLMMRALYLPRSSSFRYALCCSYVLPAYLFRNATIVLPLRDISPTRTVLHPFF